MFLRSTEIFINLIRSADTQFHQEVLSIIDAKYTYARRTKGFIPKLQKYSAYY